jgi:hypothetical protein
MPRCVSDANHYGYRSQYYKPASACHATAPDSILIPSKQLKYVQRRSAFGPTINADGRHAQSQWLSQQPLHQRVIFAAHGIRDDIRLVHFVLPQ